MADVFVSYTRADRDLAARVVAVFEAQGWSVWWDAEIEGGERWDARIEREIDAAACVVALFTPRSALRDFVLAEANRAREHAKLVPVMIDLERPPLAFSLVQARDLSGWDGLSETPVVHALLADARRLLAAAQRSDDTDSAVNFDARIHLEAPIAMNRHGAWFLPGAGKAEWFKDSELAPEMVIVPAGRYVMGSPLDEPQREQQDPGAEGPAREVTIGAPLAVGRCVVTRREFKAFIQATRHPMTGSAAHVLTDDLWGTPANASWRFPGFDQEDSHPVTCVNWDDAQAYVLWLTQLTGKRYRLLSEAEWEYVARAGTSGPFWWGGEITSSRANYDARHVYAGGGSKGDYRRMTVPALAYAANPWGLFNVHGNVWEWCADTWHPGYGGAPTDGSAWTSEGQSHFGEEARVLRGGSWYAKPWNVRAASREFAPRESRVSIRGFRVARELDDVLADDEGHFQREKGRIGKAGATSVRDASGSAVEPGQGRRQWFKDCNAGPEMVVVPAGRFIMGVKAYDQGRPIYNDARAIPRHRVTLARPFAVGRHAVTRGEFRAFVDASGHRMVFESELLEDGTWLEPGFAQDDSHPVVCVRWGDAQAYADWLTGVTGERYRLLSEAEWEYACRAGSPSEYWWGDEISAEWANYGLSRVGTVPVSSYPANAWGLYQMAGNVREWCADDVFANYSGAPVDGAAWLGDGFLNEKVMRGGGWNDQAEFLKSGSRNNREANGLTLQRRSNVGFRVAREIRGSSGTV